jgi:predicted MFS family arabinose efflux permease
MEVLMIATLKNKDFALLWTGGLISMTGNWMLMAALPFHVYAITNSALAASGILMAMVAPGIFFGSIAGVFIDRWDRKKVMVIVSALQAVTILGLLLVRSAEWIWVIYLTVFLESTLKNFFGPAEGALLPNLVGEEHLVPANSLNALNDNLARIIGPAIGGLLLGMIGFQSVIWADAASYLIAMVLIFLIQADNTAPARESGWETERNKIENSWVQMWKEWLAGLRYIKQKRALTGLFITMGIALFGDAILSAILVVFVQQDLGFNAIEFGWLMTARGLGGLVGGLLVGSVGQKFKPLQLISGGLLVSGASIYLMLLRPSLAVMMLVLVLIGPAIMAWLISLQAIGQKETEDVYRGRVFGAIGTSTTFIMFFGSAIAGFMADQIGTFILVAAAASFYMLAGLVSPTAFGNSIKDAPIPIKA